MAYKFSARSNERLKTVHPSLVMVAERALEISPYDFGITEGARTVERQKELVKSGKSKTMNSWHLVQEDGWSHALDFSVWVNGSITWEIGYYRKVIQAFTTAAIELGVQVEFGGLWRSFVDGPHVQLNQKYVKELS